MSKGSAAKLLELTTVAEQMGPLVTVQMLRAFVVIAQANEDQRGLNMTELGKRLDLASASRTNIVHALSTKRGGNKKLPGLGLVVTEIDPQDVRAKIIKLTPSGRRFWLSLKSVLEAI